MARDPQVIAHQEWIGYIQPVGLVVSIPALVQAQANVDRNIIPQHDQFRAIVTVDPNPAISDFPAFTQAVLDWRNTDLLGRAGGEPLPTSLEVALPEYNETLRPTYVVRDGQPTDPAKPWLMLIQELPAGTDFDVVSATDERHWQASPQARVERLLRETQVPIGMLVNRTQLRLVYAPRGENSGYATFKVADMCTVAGRPIFAALHMLLCADRLFTESPDRRLPALLANSRKHQSLVSNTLSEQFLAALYELLRGFQAADDARKGELLREVLRQDPNQVYSGLLTVLMRTVFILYAEDRGLISTDPVYVNNYSISGLFDRLRADAGRYPDTMDQRFGAWAQLLTLFRFVYDGCNHGNFTIPRRDGYLFDPDRYPFLEGRAWQSRREKKQKLTIPRVPDGVIFCVLQNLLILDGERLSYRTLDVEQIGSVYERMMGFNLEVAKGKSIAIKPKKSHGAPAAINLEELLEAKPADRVKWLLEHSDQKLTGQAADALKSAKSIDDLMVALDKKIAREATPNIMPKGAMVLQPSEERRKSGSHYTPRTLTEPIVRKTLEPILKKIGEHPTPQQILDLKVCDPAMGSGAFLVEACRQIGDALVASWHFHKQLPKIPPDEDEIKHAQRLVAQRCLYGVDKNPMAVDLAKLSFWLATLAKEHPFTFLDHSLRHGDSLVGLTRRQIAAFHWSETEGEPVFGQQELEQTIERVTKFRREIMDMPEDNPYSVALKGQRLKEVDAALTQVRLAGDLVIASFFGAENDKKRVALAKDFRDRCFDALRGNVKSLVELSRIAAKLRTAERPISPFHWDIEFPEVFCRENGGFDAMAGNPPFLGGARIWPALGPGYPDWLRSIHVESHGKAVDVIAHFFRRAFELLRKAGCLGLIATNSIAQGDTRQAGLGYICKSSGFIYSALRRMRWPGQAAVVVSVIHVRKSERFEPVWLDAKIVTSINSYLFPSNIEFMPVPLRANRALCFQGACVMGMGFTFDDTDGTGVASSLEEMREVIKRNPKNSERIFPYIGGKEINTDPRQSHHRFVIDIGDLSLEEAKQYSDLLDIVRQKVKPERDKVGGYSVAERRRECWWHFGTATPALNKAKALLDRVLVIARISNAFAPVFLPAHLVFNEKTLVFAFSTYSAFANIQCRVHETWARFFGSTLKDDFQYTPSDCFETYPFPRGFPDLPSVEATGKQYHEFRSELMIRNNEGLTQTYNRFHDPEETSTDILKLRELHAEMDRTLVDAYGWTDLKPTHEFLLDYEDDEYDDENDGGRARKKPWRYRWPDTFRDEVLARLLELNKQYAEAEARTTEKLASKKSPSKTGRRKDNDQTQPLF